MDKIREFSASFNRFSLKIDTNLNKDKIDSDFGDNISQDRMYKSAPVSLNGKREMNSDQDLSNRIYNEGNIGKDLESLRLRNYDRCNFNYNTLSTIGWFPDEILNFLEINRMSYIDFIQRFNNKSSIFDIAIRNAIYFMVQSPYCKDTAIKKFISHRTTDISDNYWNKVVDEDNCFMDGLEDRLRSKNESQHYYLMCALTKLLSYKFISIDGLVLKKEYIKKIKIFIAIYNLKNIHAMIDDTLRNVLQGCIQGDPIDLYLPSIFYGIYFDLDKSVLVHARSTSDSDLINRSYLYRDIILFGIYKTVQFSFVFNSHQEFVINNDLTQCDDNYLNPFKYEKYKYILSDVDIVRIECVYLSLYNKLDEKKTKDKLIMENTDFTKLLEQDENRIVRPRSTTPKYSMKKSEFNPNFPIFYIENDELKKKTKRKRIMSQSKRHERAISDSMNY